MASKDLMFALSARLEPVRDAFKLRLYRWAMEVVPLQALDDTSLFWSVPSRVIGNLHTLLSSHNEDRLQFFLVCLGGRHRWVLSYLELPVPSVEDVSRVMQRCISPSELDVRKNGLLPLSKPVGRLDKRNLRSAVRSVLGSFSQEKTDRSEPTEWLFESTQGQWRIVTRISTSSPDFQLGFEFDVLLGMGDLSLSRQLSLHNLLGIGPSTWDLGEPGEEQEFAKLLGKHCRYMTQVLSTLLADLDPGISPQEVQRAEREWIEWLAEIRAANQNRPPRR